MGIKRVKWHGVEIEGSSKKVNNVIRKLRHKGKKYKVRSARRSSFLNLKEA